MRDREVLIMSNILTTIERSIYKDIIEIEALSKICSKKKDFWIEQVKITREGLKKLIDTQGQHIRLAPREIIYITITKLSYIEINFLNEIEKLEYKERVSDKITYKRLNELKIFIQGSGYLDLLKKGLYIIITKLCEDSVFNE